MGVWTQRADVLAHGCIACPHRCRWWMGVWTHCMQMDEGKEKKKRKKP